MTSSCPSRSARPTLQGDVYHEVQAGQSLWQIAIAYGVKIVDIQKQNNLGTSIVIQRGEKLLIKRVPTPTPAPPTATATMRHRHCHASANHRVAHNDAATNTDTHTGGHVGLGERGRRGRCNCCCRPDRGGARRLGGPITTNLSKHGVIHE